MVVSSLSGCLGQRIGHNNIYNYQAYQNQLKKMSKDKPKETSGAVAASASFLAYKTPKTAMKQLNRDTSNKMISKTMSKF